MSDLITVMLERAKSCLSHSYAPYSNYQVASCLSTEDGSLFTGVNVENSVYGLTICAESSAICQMIAAGKKNIVNLVVINAEGTLCPPCGSCRQRIAEFAQKNTVIHLCSHQSIIRSYTVNELLPHAFKLRDRNDKKQ
ncbi:MAG: cytidine deaminase [Tatlockia sp.]|nr:cytidine deaminase [Tatlockia sp.]